MSINSIISAIIFVILIYFCSIVGIESNLTSERLVDILILDLISLFLYSFKRKHNDNLKRNFFRITPIFLVGFVIVYFQVYVDYILGNYGEFGHDYLIDNNIVIRSSIISSIALNAFFVGTMLKKRRGLKFKSDNSNNVKLPEKVMIILTYVFFGIFIGTVDWAYFKGGYGPEEFGGILLSGITSYANQFLVYSIIGYSIVKTINLRHRKDIHSNENIVKFFLKNYNFYFLTLSILYLILTLLSGDRGPIIQIVLCFLTSYFLSTKRKLKVYQAVISLALGSLLFTFIANYREFKEDLSFAQKVEKAEEKRLNTARNSSIMPSTIELASSVRTFHALVSYTKYNEHTNGLFQGIQLLGIVPGLGILVQRIFGVNFAELNTAFIATLYVFGPYPSHSLGTTSVGDIYIDFGYLGVLGLFLIFGFVVNYVENIVFSEKNISLFVLVVFFVLLSKAIYINRSTITILFREIMQIYLLIRLSLVIVGRFKIKL